MSSFYQQVRKNKIKGPNQSGFSRKQWLAAAEDNTQDQDSLRLIGAGLFMDELLSFTRSQIKLGAIPLTNSAKIRLLVALASYHLFQIDKQSKIPGPAPGERLDFWLSQRIEHTVNLSDGQAFSPDELLSGLGDGLKHMFRDLLRPTPLAQGGDEYSATYQDASLLNTEMNIAVIYHCTTQLWADCLGNGYGIQQHARGLSFIASTPQLEVSRQVSSYRRMNISAQEFMLLSDHWTHRWDRQTKERMSEIPLVIKVAGTDRIESIELGFSSRALASAGIAILARLWLEHSYYKGFLHRPLTQLGDITLYELVQCWRLIHSLGAEIYARFNDNDGAPPALLRMAPRVSAKTLLATVCKALQVGRQKAQLLIEALIFKDGPSQELWSQPLVECGQDYCLVIPCILSVQHVRIIEIWLRQGGIALDLKGGEFETFCFEDFALALRESPIKRHIQLIPQSVEFKPARRRMEQIDIVIVIADTVLLIEAKCILWPEDPLQYANYLDTVTKATEQITRKKDYVLEHYSEFRDRLGAQGYQLPEAANVVCCVLSNSAVYAGYPINDVPVVDLSIIETYFKNKYVKVASTQGGRTVAESALSFYDSPAEAAMKLESYLRSPPQLSDIKRYVKSRTVLFPVESAVHGKIHHEIYKVEMDIEDVMARYGHDYNVAK